MMPLRPPRDLELVQIVDRALADAARRAGDWLVCRPGCTQCCVGAFAINRLDAERLRSGMDDLRRSDPARARRVRERAQEYVTRIANDFPGDIRSGILDESPRGQEVFAAFADDEICPALDPETGLCDVYEYRPMTCRVFGPPIRNEGGGLGVCELCFHGASNEQIAACELNADPNGLEDVLLRELEAPGHGGSTIVACVLAEDL
jgi:Fe-S-cluster containining protein